MSNHYLALLRGINVGGNNLISKDQLRETFESLKHTNVRTYIQSGNILFESPETSLNKLTAQIEAELSQRFFYVAQAVVYSAEEYHAALASAPEGWGTDETQKHNALFPLHDLAPESVLAELPASTKYEAVSAGTGVVFWSVSIEHQTKTTWMELPKHPIYKQVTIRNSNTALKLQEMLAEMPG